MPVCCTNLLPLALNKNAAFSCLPVAINKHIKWILPVVLLAAVAVGYREFRRWKQFVKPYPIDEFTYIVNKPGKAQDGYYLLSPYMVNRWWHGRLMILDGAGNIHYQKYINGSAFNFRKWNLNGHTRYTYFVNDAKVQHSKGIKLAMGYYILADSALQQIAKIQYVPLADTETIGRQGFDMHDLIMLSDDHFIAMLYRTRKVNNIPDSLHPKTGIQVAEAVIEEVEAGKVLWHWESAQFPELYGTSLENNKYGDTSVAADYIHLNSATIDPFDSNLICSFRNNDQVLKISRRDGSILWRLGGNNSDFKLSADQIFLRQHDIHYIAGTHRLMLLDNGDSLTRPYSRVLEFKLNERERTIDSFSSYRIPEGFAQYMGSVEKIGNRYLIGGGSGNYILEVDPLTGEKYFELHSNLSTYRVYRVNTVNNIGAQLDK